MSLIECKAGQFEGLFSNECHQFFGIPYAKYEQRWDESTLIEDEIIFKAREKGNAAPKQDLMIKVSQEQAFFKTILYQNNLKIA